MAEKYYEPHLLATSALALVIHARKEQNFAAALSYIQEAERIYAALKRIPQYVESIIVYLKIILVGLKKNAHDPEKLLNIVIGMETKVSGDIIERINVFAPE